MTQTSPVQPLQEQDVFRSPCKHSRTKIIDSRIYNGYRCRRHRCSCGARFSTVELNLAENFREEEIESRVNLIMYLSESQARSLLEQINAGHKSLNLI